jgi:hypothetical protein
MPSLKNLSRKFSLEFGASHSSLEPLNLFNQSSVRSSVRSTLDLFYQSSHNQSHQFSLESGASHSSLKPLNLFNLSNARFGLNPFERSSQ